MTIEARRSSKAGNIGPMAEHFCERVLAFYENGGEAEYQDPEKQAEFRAWLAKAEAGRRK